MKKMIFVLTMVMTLTLFGCEQGDTGFDSEATINPYTRDTSSGTRDGFMSGIGFSDAATDNSLLGDNVTVSAGNDEVLQSVNTDRFGIGYISLYSVNDDIKPVNFEGVEPAIENVVDESYALTRPFNYITRLDDDYESETEKEIAEAFVAFMLSSEGSDIINDNGAVAVSNDGNWDDLSADHPVCDADNSEESISFGGSNSVEGIAKDLATAFSSRCGDVQTVNNHTGSSDGFKRTQGDEKDGTNMAHVGFASRPFKDDEKVNGEDYYGTLAQDAIVIVVNNENPLDDIDADTLKKLYQGDYSTWADILD
ncbi:MAG: substrate-binding domain-containing protein [Bacillota bacterium]